MTPAQHRTTLAAGTPVRLALLLLACLFTTLALAQNSERNLAQADPADVGMSRDGLAALQALSGAPILPPSITAVTDLVTLSALPVGADPVVFAEPVDQSVAEDAGVRLLPPGRAPPASNLIQA